MPCHVCRFASSTPCAANSQIAVAVETRRRNLNHRETIGPTCGCSALQLMMTCGHGSENDRQGRTGHQGRAGLPNDRTVLDNPQEPSVKVSSVCSFVHYGSTSPSRLATSHAIEGRKQTKTSNRTERIGTAWHGMAWIEEDTAAPREVSWKGEKSHKYEKLLMMFPVAAYRLLPDPGWLLFSTGLLSHRGQGFMQIMGARKELFSREA